MKTWEDWEDVHQPFELRYHIEQGIQWCRDEQQFRSFWTAIFDWMEPKGECLDVGCGPRPPFGFGSFALDPLVDQYRKLVPEWWEGIQAVSLPAERFVPEYAGQFDTVLCWNCLDHTIGWQQILQNLTYYGKPDATYAISTDFDSPSVGHPGFDKDEFLAEIGKRFQITRRAEAFCERDLALVLKCV